MLMATSVLVAAGGCGSGDPGEDSAHARGSEGRIGAITVQNAYLVPALRAGTCVIQYDGPAELSFTATNGGLEPDRLTGVTTDAAASVRLQATPEELVVPAEGALAAGQPIGPSATEEPITVQVNQLADWVRPGRNLDMRFIFERAGTLELAVPVDSCPTQQTP